MTDRFDPTPEDENASPDNSSQSKPSEETPKGGWRRPSDASMWEKPAEEKKSAEGWVVPAFPDDLEIDPDKTGFWHLPRPEDTVFDKDSTIELPKSEESASPEDMIADILKEGTEDELEQIEDDEYFSVSELLSRQELADEEDKDTDPETEDADEQPTIAASQLNEVELSQTITTEEEADAESAADVARRMAEQLAAEESGDTSAPSQTESLDVKPQLTPLQEKFVETRRIVHQMRDDYRADKITHDELQTKLRQHMILDDDKVWWMMGVDTDTWYKYEGGQWVESTPPVTIPSEDELKSAEDIAGSLPYSPSPSETQAPTPTQTQPPAETYTSPLVQTNVPVTDPGATVVSGAAFPTSFSDAAKTIESTPADPGATMPVGAVDATVPVTPTGSDVSPLVESAFDDSDPYYDLDSEAPVFDEFAQEERNRAIRRVAIGLLALLACGLITGILGSLAMVIAYQNAVGPYRDQINALANYQPEFRTARIFDVNGELIAELNNGGGARTNVELDEISPFLLHAIVSQENERFFDDPGFDLLSIVRAFIQNFTAGEIESGASTITQQVARNFVIGDAEISATRKLTEILVSQEIARTYDKNFILDLYVNEIFFGNQSYGVESASQFYFNKSARDVNMAESAMLAAIIPAPSANDPVVNKEIAVNGMNSTLKKMIQVGCLQFQHGEWPQRGPFCISSTQTVERDGQQVPLFRVNSNLDVVGGVLINDITDIELTEFLPREFQIRYPHFVNYVQSEVEEIFGTGALFQRGFNIYTTLVPRVQDSAQNQVSVRVQALSLNGVNAGAALVADPRTGAIRAMVGSHDFNDEAHAGQINFVNAYNQPGSAIKPVVYAAALEGRLDGQYYTPATILWNVRTDYGGYIPTNFGNTGFTGPVTVRQALQRSYNVPAVKVMEFIGVDKFLDIANRMSLQFLDGTSFGLPTALGANEVRLFDLVEAYGILANDGVALPLYAIERITEDQDGQEVTVYSNQEDGAEPQQVVSPQVAYLMQNILSDDPSRAAAFGANTDLTLSRFGIPTQDFVAAKTGTNNDGSDLWTVGFTDNVVAGVWLGTFDDIGTSGVTGFTAVAPVWNRIMESALAGLQVNAFAPPPDVIRSASLPTDRHTGRGELPCSCE